MDFSWVKRKWGAKKQLTKWKKYLHALTTEEKVVLNQYLCKGTRTADLPYDNGVVQGLEHSNIIYCSSQVGSLIDGWAFNIMPWAWEYLNKNKHLIDISKETESD